MAKITIAGDAAVVTSAMKLEDIKTIEKYRPKLRTGSLTVWAPPSSASTSLRRSCLPFSMRLRLRRQMC
mgnify:CR=1 FL=1